MKNYSQNIDDLIQYYSQKIYGGNNPKMKSQDIYGINIGSGYLVFSRKVDISNGNGGIKIHSPINNENLKWYLMDALDGKNKLGENLLEGKAFMKFLYIPDDYHKALTIYIRFENLNIAKEIIRDMLWKVWGDSNIKISNYCKNYKGAEICDITRIILNDGKLYIRPSISFSDGKKENIIDDNIKITEENIRDRFDNSFYYRNSNGYYIKGINDEVLKAIKYGDLDILAESLIDNKDILVFSIQYRDNNGQKFYIPAVISRDKNNNLTVYFPFFYYMPLDEFLSNYEQYSISKDPLAFLNL